MNINFITRNLLYAVLSILCFIILVIATNLLISDRSHSYIYSCLSFSIIAAAIAHFRPTFLKKFLLFVSFLFLPTIFFPINDVWKNSFTELLLIFAFFAMLMAFAFLWYKIFRLQ